METETSSALTAVSARSLMSSTLSAHQTTSAPRCPLIVLPVQNSIFMSVRLLRPTRSILQVMLLQHCRGYSIGVPQSNSDESKAMRQNQLTPVTHGVQSKQLTAQPSTAQPSTAQLSTDRSPALMTSGLANLINVPQNFYIVFSTLADTR